jgi:hypothetical protein
MRLTEQLKKLNAGCEEQAEKKNLIPNLNYVDDLKLVGQQKKGGKLLKQLQTVKTLNENIHMD